MFTKNAPFQKRDFIFVNSEKDARFPRVEFVDFRKIRGVGGKGGGLRGDSFNLFWLVGGWLGWTQEGRQCARRRVNHSFQALQSNIQIAISSTQDSTDPQDCRTTRLPGLQDSRTATTLHSLVAPGGPADPALFLHDKSREIIV